LEQKGWSLPPPSGFAAAIERAGRADRKRTSAVLYGQDGQDGLGRWIPPSCINSRRFGLQSCAVSILRLVFFRLFVLRRSLSRARREGAVLHGMDDPHPLMPRPPSLARSKHGSKISWPRKPEREVSFLAALVKFSFTDLLEDWSAAWINADVGSLTGLLFAAWTITQSKI